MLLRQRFVTPIVFLVLVGLLANPLQVIASSGPQTSASFRFDLDALSLTGVEWTPGRSINPTASIWATGQISTTLRSAAASQNSWIRFYLLFAHSLHELGHRLGIPLNSPWARLDRSHPMQLWEAPQVAVFFNPPSIDVADTEKGKIFKEYYRVLARVYRGGTIGNGVGMILSAAFSVSLLGIAVVLLQSPIVLIVPLSLTAVAFVLSLTFGVHANYIVWRANRHPYAEDERMARRATMAAKAARLTGDFMGLLEYINKAHHDRRNLLTDDRTRHVFREFSHDDLIDLDRMASEIHGMTIAADKAGYGHIDGKPRLSYVLHETAQGEIHPTGRVRDFAFFLKRHEGELFQSMLRNPLFMPTRKIIRAGKRATSDRSFASAA